MIRRYKRRSKSVRAANSSRRTSASGRRTLIESPDHVIPSLSPYARRGSASRRAWSEPSWRSSLYDTSKIPCRWWKTISPSPSSSRRIVSRSPSPSTICPLVSRERWSVISVTMKAKVRMGRRTGIWRLRSRFVERPPEEAEHETVRSCASPVWTAGNSARREWKPEADTSPRHVISTASPSGSKASTSRTAAWINAL